jgi:hypothetical protein
VSPGLLDEVAQLVEDGLFEGKVAVVHELELLPPCARARKIESNGILRPLTVTITPRSNQSRSSVSTVLMMSCGVSVRCS